MEFNVLLVVAAVGGLILTVRAGQRFGAVVDLPGMARYLVLVGCQIITALTLEGTLSCMKGGKQMSIECRGY